MDLWNPVCQVPRWIHLAPSFRANAKREADQPFERCILWIHGSVIVVRTDAKGTADPTPAAK
jgi:hypothetical protein